MATKIEAFDGGDFAEYLERLEFYFTANDTGVVASSASATEKNRAQKKLIGSLISQLSKSAYATLKSLCLPDLPSSKSYDELCALLTEHYKDKTTTTTAAYKFRQCVQHRTDSVEEYSHRLKRAAQPCEFGTHLDRAMKDQFIAGLSSQSIKRKILSCPDKDIDKFNKVFKIAHTEDIAAAHAEELTRPAQCTDDDDVGTTGTHKLMPDKGNYKPKRTPPPTSGNTTQRSCYRCGSSDHLADKCFHKTATCRYCQKEGHLERVCLRKKRRQACHSVQADTTDDYDETGEGVPLFKINDESIHSTRANGPLFVPVNVNGACVDMELDTGSGVTVLTRNDFTKCKGDVKALQKPTVVLRGFSGAKITCLGEMQMPVTIAGSTKNVLLRVVNNEYSSLLGRDWLNEFTLPWKQILAENVHRVLGTDTIKQEFPALFEHSTLGKMRGVQVTLHVDEAKPMFCKPRPVPFHIRERYDAALDQLESDGVIRKVTHSDWASPTVPVQKPDGKIRVCGDYSVTINKCSKMEHHPLPTLEEMLTKLSGGTKFTKLDLSQAYHQLELNPESRKYTTINTHRGLFEYNRLPFGVSSAVSIFQRTMENLLADLPGCVVYIDDILVTGKNEAEHLHNLRKVLQHLEDAGMKLKSSKKELMSDTVTYLGHKISANGLNPTSERVTALQNARQPNDIAELQSFIGSANYLRQFIPHFAQKMAPLYVLLKRDTAWHWGAAEQTAFDEIRNAMSEEATLSHFSMTKDVVLQVDASGKGLGAVLLQQDENKFLRPVAFASRVLTTAEKNYSQIEREALALVFGAHKFRQYLLGKPFTLRTDHKPLLPLFDPHKTVPMLTSTRLKKWRLVLSAYSYTLEFVPGKQNIFADYLSRKPEAIHPSPAEMIQEEVLQLAAENILNADAVAAETRKDPVLSKVLQFTKNGWPVEVHPDLMPYYRKRLEITLQHGVLVWDSRVVVPQSLQTILLLDLHSEHTGMVRMKRMARQYVWWPNIDSQIEETVRQCTPCQENAKKPTQTQGVWSWPAGPWRRIHLDFAGPFLGKMFLVLVDSFSKFIDVVPMSTATTTNVIGVLRANFAIFGLPEHIVTDNGTQFTSGEFNEFLKANGVLHTLTAPGHPATNGLAERYVGAFQV